jgi:diacylglycerol kinase (ATP)
VAVIVNRLAGRSRGAGWEHHVAAVLRTRVRPTFVHPSASAATATVAVAQARAGAAAIVVAGGDGTVNQVVNALAGTGVPIAILPCGTANDLARELRLPGDPVAAACRLTDGRVRSLDLIEVNGRLLATVGGLGLPAACALSVADLKRAGGTWAWVLPWLGASVYPLVAAATVLATRRDVPRLRVTIRRPDGTTLAVERESHGLLVANQCTLGGGLVLPTRSRNDDGVFELAILSRDSCPRLLATLLALRLGLHVSRAVLPVWGAVEATIESERPLRFFGDGEELDRGGRFTLRIRPGALEVIC